MPCALAINLRLIPTCLNPVCINFDEAYITSTKLHTPSYYRTRVNKQAQETLEYKNVKSSELLDMNPITYTRAHYLEHWIDCLKEGTGQYP